MMMNFMMLVINTYIFNINIKLIIKNTENNISSSIINLDSDTDTLVTAESLFNSPSESLQDINLTQFSPYNPLICHSSSQSTTHKNIVNRRHSTDSTSSSGSSDTLVDGVSITSSCGTYMSQGGTGYKCARSEFSFRPNMKRAKHMDDLLSFQYR